MLSSGSRDQPLILQLWPISVFSFLLHFTVPPPFCSLILFFPLYSYYSNTVLDMDYRRLQHSYPPRPSPLGASQEPRDPQFAPFTESRQETDKPRPYPSPSSNTTPSPSQLYQSTASRTSNNSRGDTPSAYFPRNGPTQAHRRHGSLETRNHEQIHRCFCLFSPAQMVPMPRIEDSKDRTCAVVGLHFVTFQGCSSPLLGGMRDRRKWGSVAIRFRSNLCDHIQSHSPKLAPSSLAPTHCPPDGFSPVAQIDWTTARER